ncbi:kinase-like domain-containing protein [Mycena rebaudengoi]|nr:kinase-like domain-containing protein [Mycena rebaudengoi]
MRKPTRSRSPEAFAQIPLTGENSTGVPAADSSSRPPERADYSPSSLAPPRVLVYQRLLSFLQDVSRAMNPSIASTLDEHHSTMSATDTVSALVKSRESRAALLQAASHLGISSDPNLREALNEDETRIATHVLSILDSQTTKEAILLLEGDSAQHFLDVIQHILDRGLLIEQQYNAKARRMILKLSEACDKLPSSLFITGVSGRDHDATFGGGFGDIYQASYGGKTVALKRMRTFHRGSELRRIRLQFCREALIWQDLKHPYILPMLGIDRESFPSSLCMVSPWMENGTVLNYLEEHGRQDVDRLLWEVAQGLEYLHSRNIVHGDLRGANILITQDWSACLTDFGLTSFTDTTAATTTSHRAGTIRWMAPELIDPDRFGLKFRRTTASDVYAFACVCLELYTGRPPFADVREGGVVLKIVQGERPAQPSTMPPMSEALWKYVSEWWAEDPATRPPAEMVVGNITVTKSSDHTNLIEYPSEPKQSQESYLLDHLYFDVDARRNVSALNISLLEKDSDAISPVSSGSIDFSFCQTRIWQKRKSQHWHPYSDDRNSRPGATRKPFPDIASTTAVPHNSLIFGDVPDSLDLRDSQTPDAQRFELVEISETSPITSPGYDARTKCGTCIDAQASLILPVQGPDLPPSPTFAVMPPMSTITSLAGSGCTCGFECGCADCGPGHAAKYRAGGADRCKACVDAHTSIVLPAHELAASTSTFTNGRVEQFLVRAATLPAPPNNRKMPSSVWIDPMNTIVYPTTAMETPERGVPFGLVSLPKLRSQPASFTRPWTSPPLWARRRSSLTHS